MIDEELLADLCPGMDIDARDAVRVLGDHPWQQRNLEPIPLVRQVLVGDGQDARVAEVTALTPDRRDSCRGSQYTGP